MPAEVAGGTPEPAKPTNCGLPVALSPMFNVAEREPVAVGMNVTLIEQFPPALTLDPQVLICWKSPALAPATEIVAILSFAFSKKDGCTSRINRRQNDDIDLAVSVKIANREAARLN